VCTPFFDLLSSQLFQPASQLRHALFRQRGLAEPQIAPQPKCLVYLKLRPLRDLEGVAVKAQRPLRDPITRM